MSFILGNFANNMTNALDAGLSVFADRMDAIRQQNETREDNMFAKANRVEELFKSTREEASQHEAWIERAQQVRLDLLREQFDVADAEYALLVARNEAEQTRALRATLVQELRDGLDFYTATAEGLSDMCEAVAQELIQRAGMNADQEWLAATVKEQIEGFLAFPWVEPSHPTAQSTLIRPRRVFAAPAPVRFPAQPDYVPPAGIKMGMKLFDYNFAVGMAFANWIDAMAPVRSKRRAIMQAIFDETHRLAEQVVHLKHQITVGKAQAEVDKAYARYQALVIDGLRHDIRFQQAEGFAWYQIYVWYVNQIVQVPQMQDSPHNDPAAREELLDKHFRHARAKILGHQPLEAHFKDPRLTEVGAGH